MAAPVLPSRIATLGGSRLPGRARAWFPIAGGGRLLPLTLRALLVVAAAVAAALAGRAALGRLVRPDRVAAARPTADLVMEAMAGLYGVLVAFLLAGAWERLDQTRATMVLEANALASLRQIAGVLPAPTGDELAAAAAAYQERALEGLALLAEGRNEEDTDARMARLWRIIAGIEPATPGQAELQARAFEAVQELESQHRTWIHAVRRPLPPILWAMLVGGAVAVLCPAAISSLGSRLRAVYFVLLAAVISFALFVIYTLSYPVRSGLAAGMAPILGTS